MNMKRFLSAAVITAMLVSMTSIQVDAFDGNDTEFLDECNASELIDPPLSPMDNNYPTSSWNLIDNGRYDFSGSANGSASIYTLYYFTGASNVHLYVCNDYSSSLHVYVKNQNFPHNTIDSFYVSSGTGVNRQLSVSSNTKFYLQFDAPNSFHGYVSGSNS